MVCGEPTLQVKRSGISTAELVFDFCARDEKKQYHGSSMRIDSVMNALEQENASCDQSGPMP